jgi:site-specific DNA-methyltransferase (adenine-specific)
VVSLFPETNGKVGMTQHGSGTNQVFGRFERSEKSLVNDGVSDSGSAARFFYCAKESKRDIRKFHKNTHPTVKPFTLMRYLTRLVQPPSGGVILDPFCGSGSTGVGAIANGSKFIGIDIDDQSLNTASVRLSDGVKNRFVTIKDKKRR